MSIKRGLLIGGQECPAKAGAQFDVFAPETGKKIGIVAQGDAQDIDDAVQAARQGFGIWSALPAKDRERVLLRAADIIESEGQARLLDLLIDESGSCITKARAEIAYTPDLLRAAAGEARRLQGDTFPNDRPDRLSFVVREPVGVVGILSPYNAPLSLLAKMTAFPLAAGNAVVIKPSEDTPLMGLAFGDILLEAGLPPAALSVVTGFGSVAGAALAEHRGIDALALTGATQTGRVIAANAGRALKRVQLELGGKNALVVLADFDPVEAAAIAAAGIFTHAGQICMANSRVIVERAIYSAFLLAFKAQAESLHLGDLRDLATIYGPLINQRAVDKIKAQQENAIASGARLITGGHVVRGLTWAPTILADTPQDCDAWRVESFGPLVNVVAANDFDHAIALANDSDYGLSAGVLTHDVTRAFLAARRIKAGSVHIGMHPFQSNTMAPIGGYKDSGIGRSGGRYSTQEFTQLKWISLETGLP